MRIQSRHVVLAGAAAVLVGSLLVLSQPWRAAAPTPVTEPAVRDSVSSSNADREVPELPDAPAIETPAPDAPQWIALYQESADRFAFAETAAAAAVAGDARAQYALSQALLECYVEVALTVAQGKGDLSANIEARVVAFPGYQELDRIRIRRQVQRCERFFHGSPLASLSLPEEEQSHQYWFDRALAAGDPLATMDRAAKVVAQSDFSDEEARVAVGRAVLEDVRVAVASREPGAVAKVGWMYTNHMVARDQTFQGPAWLMAACQLGYDCSYTNPEIGRGCVEASTCGPTLADIFQRDLGPGGYARAYAAGQDIAYKVTQGDWDGLQQYLATRM